MKMIGLTGGIGSGKSTVAKLLAEHGFPVVDADQLAREVVEPGQPALAELAEAFGQDVLLADGSLNRSELAARAFVDKERTELLNAITHPRIQELRERRFQEAKDAGSDAVVYDMPLLVEQGVDKNMDLTVVVDVDVEERIRRLVATRGLTEEDARRRIAAQVADAERLAAADVVIDNNGPVEALGEQVDQLVRVIRGRGAGRT
ncbi:dephospho-CoA kinase [Corynebacterium maris DSM 45190]|uniref:Dephospho-CoA kinase n=1 Tax=Corynebacterium maris DSM 45190 TaxID=1224163 RepID=S5TIK0_9CORY|nr:dephospho-CoA kinase [Corynebacterium maris]AGS34731.1 dephospho-CoA kinase [Corynebacterium maris DSM 45190]